MGEKRYFLALLSLVTLLALFFSLVTLLFSLVALLALLFNIVTY